jgi:assimilatory nitrate reductase electron transfer subunit
MAATRLVEHLVALDYAGQVTVLGEEPVAPYNRILLSALLEQTHDRRAVTLRPERWYAAHGIDLRLGHRVLAVDRTHRDVMMVDGSLVGWDRLVLATGSIPTLPPMRGVVRPDGTLHPKVHAFRSLADCDGLLAAVPSARRAVIVGGGLLGLQVTRALTVRGLTTELVEGAEHVLSRQVTGPAGRVLARSLERLGSQVYTGARGVRLHDHGDGSVGVQLDNGVVLDTDLVVLTAGGRPSVALARNAGLAVRRGVVVDDHLASVTDPDVHAIGDCAEHRGHLTGFVAPAWEQAGVLARRLCGEDVVHGGSRTVARLRATGLDVAVLGDPLRCDGEVVEVSNPVTGKHHRLVVRDGVVAAATLVGDLSRVGLLTQLYDRRTRLGPREPGELLLPESVPSQGENATAAALPDDAEVCACAGVTAGAIRGCRSIEEVRGTTRATTGCGGCALSVQELLTRSGRDPAPSTVG